MKERQVRNEVHAGEERNFPICKIHKRDLEFVCLNEACSQFRQSGCAKCLLPKQIHENCSVEPSNDYDENQLDRTLLLKKFQKRFDHFENELLLQMKTTKTNILRQIQYGKAAGIDTAQQILESLHEFNNCEADNSDRALSIQDIFTHLYDFQFYHANQSSSQSKIKSEEENEDLHRSQQSHASKIHKSVNDLVNESYVSHSLNQSSASIQTSTSRMLESLGFSSSLQSVNQSFQSTSSLSKSKSIVQNNNNNNSSMNANQQQLQLQKQQSASKQIRGGINHSQQSSIKNIKGLKLKRFQIESEFIETFCLFETSAGISGEKTAPLENQNEKRSLLITRCEKKEISIIDLGLEREISRISLTHDGELIEFKQLNDRAIVISCPNSTYFQIQDIFDETCFNQVDFKFKIDSFTCDPSHGGLIFLSHSQGLVSLWSLSRKELIVESFRVSKTSIFAMDYAEKILLACGIDGSVKQLTYCEFDQSLTLNKAIVPESAMASRGEESLDSRMNHVKIVNPGLFVFHTAAGFLDVYKNGRFCNEFSDSEHEQLEPMNDMRVYENRYCVLKSTEDENIACIYDLNELKLIKTIKTNPDTAIIGAYFLNEANLVLILDNGSIQFYH